MSWVNLIKNFFKKKEILKLTGEPELEWEEHLDCFGDYSFSTTHIKGWNLRVGLDSFYTKQHGYTSGWSWSVSTGMCKISAGKPLETSEEAVLACEQYIKENY